MKTQLLKIYLTLNHSITLCSNQLLKVFVTRYYHDRVLFLWKTTYFQLQRYKILVPPKKIFEKETTSAIKMSDVRRLMAEGRCMMEEVSDS